MKIENWKLKIKSTKLIWLGCLLFGALIIAPAAQAFQGPTCTAPSNCSILTASGTYLGIGTTTPAYPLSVVGHVNIYTTGGSISPLSTTDTGASGVTWIFDNGYTSQNGAVPGIFGLRGGTTRFVIQYSNGYVGIATTTPGYPLTVSGNIFTTGSLIGTLSGALSAANITSDVFGRLQGNGNFAFPANLGVGTSTQNGLPQALSVYGGGYFSGSVGIGTTGPGYALTVNGEGSFGSQTEKVFINTGRLSFNREMGAGTESDNTKNGFDLYNNNGTLSFETYNTAGSYVATPMTITYGGNVGIGTVSPSYKLTVQSAGTSTSPFVILRSVAAGGGPRAWFGEQSGGDYQLVMQNNAGTTNVSLSTNGYSYLNGGYVGIGTASPSNVLQVSSANTSQGGIDIANTSAGGINWRLQSVGSGTAGRIGNFELWNASTSILALAIQPGGNVGIGTTTPAYPLTVNGVVASLTGGFRFPDGTTQTTAFAGGTQTTNAAYVTAGTFGSSATSSNSQYLFKPTTDTTAALGVQSSGGTSVFDVDTLNQRVGIGTASPSLMLDVRGTAALPPSSGTTPAGNIAITQSGGVAGYIGINPNSPYGMWLQTGNNQTGLNNVYPLLLNPNGGNVGIGTTTPSNALSVQGDVSFQRAGGTTLTFQTPSTDARIYASGASTNLLLNPSTGNVGIGTTTPAYPLTVNGIIYSATGGVRFPDGTTQTTAFNGGTQQTNAAYVTQGTFGSSVPGSNNQYLVKPTTNTTAAFHVQTATGGAVFDVDTSNSRIGIGTESPAVRLEIASTTAGTNAMLIGNDNSIGFRRADGGIVGMVGMGANDWMYLGMPTSTGAGNTLDINYSYNLIFSHQGTQRAMFTGTNGDRFILGTTDNGSDMFQVNGTSYFGNQVTINGNLNLGTNSISMSTASSSITVNKLNVNTIDPLYDIGGVKYATYGSAIAGGVKEEYVGQAQLVSSSKYLVGGTTYSYVIDFNKVATGSDLWVWRKAVDFGTSTVSAFATPIGTPAAMAYQIEGNSIVFTGTAPVAFSYRLVGSRFDWQSHPTLAPDQGVPTSLIVK